MEGEAGIGRELWAAVARLAVDQREPRTALGLPAEVLDVGPTRQRQGQGVDQERELGQHDPALGQPEGVHVGGLLDRLRGDHAQLRERRVHREEAVAARGPELGRVVDHPAAVSIEVGVGRGELARSAVGRRIGRLQCAGVELHRQRGLGHRHEPLAQARDVDVGVVGYRLSRREHRLDSLEQ